MLLHIIVKSTLLIIILIQMHILMDNLLLDINYYSFKLLKLYGRKNQHFTI